MDKETEAAYIRNERNVLLQYAQMTYDFLTEMLPTLDDCDPTKDRLKQILEMAPDKVPPVKAEA